MSQYTRPCNWCEGDMPDGLRGARKYCSEGCQKDAANERSLQRGPTCADCGGRMHRGKDVLPQGQARCSKCRNGGAGYYTTEEGRWSHGRSAYSQGCRCRVCKDAQAQGMRDYVAKRKAERGVTPSAESRRRARGHNPFQPVFDRKPVPCAVCGDVVRSVKPPGEAVHKKCRGVGDSWYISESERWAVYERDGWECRICFNPVDPDAHYLSDWYPTLDHIVPRSISEDHSPENLRLACRYCNIARLDRPVSKDYLVRDWAMKRRSLEVV